MKNKDGADGFRPGHVGLNVTDLDRSKEFYALAFGLEVLSESKEKGREHAFLGTDGRILVTLWQQGEEGFDARSAGLHHLAFEAGSLAGVEAAEGRLARAGVRFHQKGVVAHREHSGSAGIFFEDPDGIRLEIYCETETERLAAPAGGAPACGFF